LVKNHYLNYSISIPPQSLSWKHRKITRIKAERFQFPHQREEAKKEVGTLSTYAFFIQVVSTKVNAKSIFALAEATQF